MNTLFPVVDFLKNFHRRTIEVHNKYNTIAIPQTNKQTRHTYNLTMQAFTQPYIISRTLFSWTRDIISDEAVDTKWLHSALQVVEILIILRFKLHLLWVGGRSTVDNLFIISLDFFKNLR